DFTNSRNFFEQALALKEKSLGPDHPDVAITLNGLADTLLGSGEPEAALKAANRALSILVEHSDPESIELAATFANQGEALRVLGRYAEAEVAFQSSLRIYQQLDPMHPESAYALRGLGESKVAKEEPAQAVPLLERALVVCAPDKCTPALAAD